ncbi:hypothetical protein CPC08DRAFT_647129, partial [Agrocybe pediades]
GPVLIGFTFNAILLGVMLTQVYIYFTSYRKDSKWIKLYVAMLLVLDLFNTVADAVFIYQALILNFEPAVTACIVSAVQFFYAWRIYALMKSYVFPILIILNGIIGLVASLVASVKIGKMPLFSDMVHDKPSMMVWILSEVVGDVIITIVLAKHRTGFKKTDMLIDKIIRITIQTGMLTATFAMVDLIVYLVDPTGLHLLFNFALAKLYSNTLMSTLNSREVWMSDSPGGSRFTIGGGGSRSQDEVVSTNLYTSSPPKPVSFLFFCQSLPPTQNH